MKKMQYFLMVLILFHFASVTSAQKIAYTNPWSEAGINLQSSSAEKVGVDFSIHALSVEDITINGQVMSNISLPGSFLFNDEGHPNLPATAGTLQFRRGPLPG